VIVTPMTGALVRIGFEVMDANLHPGDAVPIAVRRWRRKLRAGLLAKDRTRRW
jgi:hypothetical protein